MHFAAIYSQRVGMAPVMKESSPPALVDPPATSHVNNLGRAKRIIERGRSEEFLKPTVGPPPDGTSWASSWLQTNSTCDRMGAWLTYLESKAQGSFLCEVEADFASKFCVQNGGMWGWDIRRDGVGRKGGDPIPEAYAAAHRLVSAAPYTPKHVSVPKNTNCGWPFYITGVVGKLLCALAAYASGFDVSRTNALLSWAAAEIGTLDEPHSILFSRTGPIKKAQPTYTVLGTSIYHTGSAKGLACRRRAVNGVSTASNICLQAQAKGVQAQLQASPIYYHTHPGRTLARALTAVDAIRARGGRPSVWEDDIGSFDLSVQGCHQRSLETKVYAPLWGARKAAEWREVQWMPLLAPPVDLSFAGVLYRKPQGGETTSGMISTSTDGNYHNTACLLECLAAAYRVSLAEIERRVLSGEICLFIWGDDTMMVLDERGFDPEAYMARAAQIGYERKLRGRGLEGATFLSIYYDLVNRRWHSLSARDVNQTAFREHYPLGRASEVLAAFFRFVPRNASLNPNFPDAWRALNDTSDLFSSYSVRDLDGLARLVTRPSFQGEVAAEVNADANRRAALALRLRESAFRNDPGTAGLREYLERVAGLGGADAEVDVITPLAGMNASTALALFKKGVAEMAASGRTPQSIKKLVTSLLATNDDSEDE